MASRYFPTTRRSLLRDASVPGPKRRKAVREMCDRYRAPSLDYSRRRLFFEPALAEDIVQDVIGTLLSEAGLERLREFEGSFGSFLAGALDNRIDKEIRARMTAKRGAGARTQSLDAAPALARQDGRDPETLFFEIVTQHHLVLALARVAERWDERGRAEDFTRLAPRLFRSGHEVDEAGREIVHSAADRTSLSRLRAEVFKSLRSVTSDWVDPAQVDAEYARWLAHLQMDAAQPSGKAKARRRKSSSG